MRGRVTILSKMLIVLIVPILAGLDCKENSVEAKYTAGRRDYVWSIDPVDYGNLPSRIELESIWGSSTNDVWGAAGDAPDVRDCLWHYNGVKWSRATAGTPITEYTGNKTVYAVWGSAKNDVWAFGRKINQSALSAFIMHYDGSSWTDATPSNVSSLKSILYAVYGVSKNNIWVGGYEYALHYDGQTWASFKVADSVIVGSITGNNKNIYLSVYCPYEKDYRLIYKYFDNTFSMLDSTTFTRHKFGNICWATNTELNTLADGVISTTVQTDGNIDTSGWHRIFTANAFLTEKYIQSINNIFLVGQGSSIYHYNGDNWKQLYISVPNHKVDPYGWLWGVWANEDQVFICDVDNGIVYHGR